MAKQSNNDKERSFHVMALESSMARRRKANGGPTPIPKGAAFVDTEEKSHLIFLGPAVRDWSHIVVGISAPVAKRAKPRSSRRRKGVAKK